MSTVQRNYTSKYKGDKSSFNFQAFPKKFPIEYESDLTFQCIFCSESYKEPETLVQHMKLKHPDLIEMPKSTDTSREESPENSWNQNSDKSELQTVERLDSVGDQDFDDDDDDSCSTSSSCSDSSKSKLVMDLDQNSQVSQITEEITQSSAPSSPPSPEFEEHIPMSLSMEKKEEVAEDEEEDLMDYDDFEYNSAMEPICELLDENGSEIQGNAPNSAQMDAAMVLYRMAMEQSYQESGIKRRGKRKSHLTFDENSSDASNGVAIMTPPETNQVIKIPQGPGRGRRREINEIEMDSINSGGGCFFSCSVCDKVYKYAGDLAKHVRSHTMNRCYQCALCGKNFTHIGSLNTHLRIHSGVRPYKCIQCEKAFTQSNSLMVHMKSHLNQKPFQCDRCNKGFLNAASLSTHQKTHTEDVMPLHVCTVCDKSFKLEHLLTEHLKIHEQSQYLYQCSLCLVQFEQACLLVQHMKSHTGEKPYACDICSKKFTQPGSLSTHLRIHTGEKPFKCSLCHRNFTQASSLSVHMKVHLGDKQFKCNFKLCTKSYSQQSYLQKHIQTSHSIISQLKALSCIFCQESFDTPANLQKHVNRQHSDNPQYGCVFCELKFQESESLIEHLRTHV